MIELKSARRFSLAAVLFLAAAPAALAGPGGSHPYFNDRGTLTWFEDVDSAERAAACGSKVIFIEYGRRACGNCRTLVSCVMTNPAVQSRLSATCIGLAADCDEPDPRVEALFSRNLPNASMLPFVGIVTADMRWITGWAGSTDVGSVSQAVSQAEGYLRRCARPAPAPVPPPAPVRAPDPIPVAPPPPPPAPPAPPPPPPPAPLAVVPEAPKPEPAPAPVTPPAALAETPPAPAVVPAPIAPPAAPKPAPRIATTAAVPASKPATPVRSGQSPTAADGAPALLAAAQAAVAAEQWGDVIRVGNEAARLPKGTDTWELDLLVHRARVWTLETMESAVDAVAARHLTEARAILHRVEKVMDRLPAAEDARRGLEAILRIEEIDRGSPDSTTPSDEARKAAYSEFRGSRWADLFKAR